MILMVLKQVARAEGGFYPKAGRREYWRNIGLYRDDGKENGNYYSIIGVYIGVRPGR